MAQTTTYITACDAVIKLENLEGSMLDVSGSTNAVDIDLQQPAGTPLRTFGSRFPVRGQCGKDATIGFRAVYSTAQAEAMNILKDWYENHPGTTRKLQVFLPDAAEGSDKYEFDTLLTRLPVNAESGNADPILVAAELVPTGTFSISVVAS